VLTSQLQADIPGPGWDDQLIRSGGHFLQSSAWLRVQQALGYPVVWDRAAPWQWAGAVRPGTFPRYLYVPYGPAAGGDISEALHSVIAAARTHHLDFARVEPLRVDQVPDVASLHGRRVRSIQPRWTWVLDISADERELRRGLEAGHRSRINAAPRRGISIRCSRDPDDVGTFLAVQRRAAVRTGFRRMPDAYHRTVASVLMPIDAAAVYVAEAEGEAVAASICYDFGPTRYYAHSASDPVEGRRLGAGPPLLWQMILDARAAGRSAFDFWGVTNDDDPRHPWAGFTRFKMAFGGRLLERAGTWDLPTRQTRYRIYSIAQRIRPR